MIALCLLAWLLPAAATDRVSREAVEALEAYAVYKMAQYPEAYRRFVELAHKGNIQGMLNAANMLQAGLGTEPDAAAALEWYRKAAEHGSAIGMFYTGRAYLYGRGAAVDRAQALEWMLAAARAGSTEAQFEYGKLLRQQGDSDEALRWIRRAAANGDSLAAVYLRGLAQGERDDSPIDPGSRALIENAWAAIDRAASNRNAPGVVHYLAHAADIRVRLPGSDNWTRMSKRELQALWQRSFDRAGEYAIGRGALGYRVSRNGIEVDSSIDERFGGADTGKALRLDESALVRISENRVIVDRLSIVISRP